ncbi:MAG: hypothetical protein ACFHX7_23720 [Pseudomonadota bacterium]
MTGNQSNETKDAVAAVLEPTTLDQRIAQIIEDPWASAFAATISCAVALGVVLGSMALISSIVY